MLVGSIKGFHRSQSWKILILNWRKGTLLLTNVQPWKVLSIEWHYQELRLNWNWARIVPWALPPQTVHRPQLGLQAPQAVISLDRCPEPCPHCTETEPQSAWVNTPSPTFPAQQQSSDQARRHPELCPPHTESDPQLGWASTPSPTTSIQQTSCNQARQESEPHPHCAETKPQMEQAS